MARGQRERGGEVMAKRKVKPSASVSLCSFCGKSKIDAGAIVEGPNGVMMCKGCATSVIDFIEEQSQKADNPDIAGADALGTSYRSLLKSMAYDAYLQTEHWKHKRQDALACSLWRCALCYASDKETTLHVHHRTYDRRGCEEPEDLTVLCCDCHAKFHDKEAQQ